MALVYHYKTLPGKKGSKVKTPSIPIYFKGNSSLKMNVIALVDSGADCSVIPKGLAEILSHIDGQHVTVKVKKAVFAGTIVFMRGYAYHVKDDVKGKVRFVWNEEEQVVELENQGAAV